MSERFAVIMAGGKGERFWPQSRLKQPKHLLPIVGDESMLAQTVKRLEGLVPAKNIWVITNQEQVEATCATCPMLKPEQIIAEPVGRDTAAAVALAMLLVKRIDASASFALLPADHVIHDASAFRQLLEKAFLASEKNPVLATVGVRPTEAATGYGYIEKGEAFESVGGTQAYRVKRFVEKPNKDVAKTYLESGDYFWNAGMFVWSVSSIQNAFQEHAPSIYNAFKQIEAELEDGGQLDDVLAKCYPELEKISIDYAVMEKATNTIVLEATFDWDDVGAWPAIFRHHDLDADGNLSQGSTLAEDAKGNLLVAPKGHFVAALGVEDLLIIQTKDATLVCPKSRAQDIKQVVKAIALNKDLNHLL